MTSHQADQLRRAIAKAIKANLDYAYALEHEPDRLVAAEAYRAQCARRLERLVKGLTVEPVE